MKHSSRTKRNRRMLTIPQDKDRCRHSYEYIVGNTKFSSDLCRCWSYHRWRYRADKCERGDDKGSSPFPAVRPARMSQSIVHMDIIWGRWPTFSDSLGLEAHPSLPTMCRCLVFFRWHLLFLLSDLSQQWCLLNGAHVQALHLKMTYEKVVGWSSILFWTSSKGYVSR